jgi:hypothetical protein
VVFLYPSSKSEHQERSMKFSELPLNQFFLCQNCYSGAWYGWRKISATSAQPINRVGRPYGSLIVFRPDDDAAVYA